jgi:DNA-binding response OmpR family regulator
MRPVIYLTDENPVVARDLASTLVKNGYEVVTLSAPDVGARLKEQRGKVVVLANIDRGGLDLAREVRSIRPDVWVVYTSSTPQKIPETAKVRGAPIMRSPIAPNQLVSVVGALAS